MPSCRCCVDKATYTGIFHHSVSFSDFIVKKMTEWGWSWADYMYLGSRRIEGFSFLMDDHICKMRQKCYVKGRCIQKIHYYVDKRTTKMPCKPLTPVHLTNAMFCHSSIIISIHPIRISKQFKINVSLLSWRLNQSTTSH